MNIIILFVIIMSVANSCI